MTVVGVPSPQLQVNCDVVLVLPPEIKHPGTVVLVKVIGVLTHPGLGAAVNSGTGRDEILILFTVAVVESQSLLAVTRTVNWFPGWPQDVVV